MWSVAWPSAYAVEHVVPRGDGGWYMSRLTGDHDHAKVAEIVSLSGAGEVERVLGFETMAWSQIAALCRRP